MTRPAGPSTTRAAPTGALGDWRRRRLLAAGFAAPLAAAIAAEPAIDLHELLLLLDRGCPPATAARILAPLDNQARWC